MSGIKKVNAGKLQNGAYRRDVKVSWWTEIGFYRAYMLREATAIFMLIYTVLLMFGLSALVESKEAFLDWATFMTCGWTQWFSVVSLLMALYHTGTWFAATPKVMPLQIGDKKVPGHLIIAANWIAFFVTALFVFALAGLS